MTDTAPAPPTPRVAPPGRAQAAAAVDARRWPDVARVPDGGAKAAVAGALFRRVVSRLAVQVVMPDGSVRGGGATGDPVMRVHRPRHLYARLADTGLVGFGEAYMAGDWSADDLAGVLTVFARRMSTLVPPVLQRLRDLVVVHQPFSERNTPDNAASNISRHYDLSNDLFAVFLDDTLTYSSALFPTDASGEPALADREHLADAQRRKVDRLLDGAGVRAGSRVLEIGTGWGELAIRAAERGAQVRSVTLSEEQAVLARRRVAAAGLSDRVSIELCDYRAVQGEYDAVVSVEMIEAVGFAFWPTYFATLDRLTSPGGRVALQAITMPHDRMMASRETYTWIHKYVFPGGIIPSVEAIHDAVARHTTLTVTDDRAMGHHYAETLRLWREAFDGRWPQVAALGFDDVFRLMWRLYLAYSEAGFRADYLDVHQFVLQKPELP